ncbi:MAG: glycerate kinase [Rhodoglobus sp.]
MQFTVVVAPDSFKGTLGARAAAEAIAAGWLSVRPDDRLIIAPQADGGEGTLDAIAAALPAAVRHAVGPVTGPDGRATPGEWLELPGGVAVVELAQASGLPLMGALDAIGATTRGLGEVIRAAVDSGARSLVIALGGSASTDGGAGALAALGLGLRDADGRTLPDGGGALTRLATVDNSGLLAPPAGGVSLLTDVAAPLLGPTGAAAVFGPQKGASPAQVAELDAALARFADLLGLSTGSGDPTARGAGAAGGTAFGFASAWGARIQSGAEYLTALTGLDSLIAGADLLLTGEGRFDEQSLGGKIVGHLLKRAAGAGVRAGVIAGQVTATTEVWTASLVELGGSVDAAMDDPARWLRAAGAQAARELAG